MRIRTFTSFSVIFFSDIEGSGNFSTTVETKRTTDRSEKAFSLRHDSLVQQQPRKPKNRSTNVGLARVAYSNGLYPPEKFRRTKTI